MITDDQAARDQILNDLDLNMLVEAGAGSGKTTSLVGRMVNLIAKGESIEHIAAVTFTRKAANELRERFQIALEERAAGKGRRADEPEYTPEDIGRYKRALEESDRAFIGTIHSFCGRLLREHPLQVALDPNFQETTGEAWDELALGFWTTWLERRKREEDPDLLKLYELGIDPRLLFTAFTTIVGNADVEFQAAEVAVPNITACRNSLESLLTQARAMMPGEEPTAGWDDLMRLVRRLEFRRRIGDWSSVTEFCAEIEYISKSKCKATQNRWSTTTDGKKAAKQLGEQFLALLDGAITELLDCWRTYRYPFVIRFLQSAAQAFEQERYAIGMLGFNDLLMLSAKLLRTHPQTRKSLGARYARLLVDEFQDTDPIQAEVCFLLASDPEQGNDWRQVMPRPGSLFFVGDPKQSIYRFRRADIQVYEFAKSRIAEQGAVVALTTNFRSVHPVATLVNEYFQNVFPETASDVQAAFRPMITVKEPEGNAIFRYTIETEGRNNPDTIDTDAETLASWIAQRIELGERSAGDFLILTQFKDAITDYVRALSARNVPVTAAGASLTQEHELQELCVVLRAIADPENPVLVAAALEGLFFGCSPADLYEAHEEGVQFVLTCNPVMPTTGGDREIPVNASTQTVPLATQALSRLHSWWRLSQQHSADVLIERMLSDTGLLYYAASQVLGGTRAGVFLHLIETLRAASATGVPGIGAALDMIEVLLDSEAEDTPLRPGRSDAVRVMNLHKAKGLEAPVVVLAAPVPNEERDPLSYVHRGDGTTPTGGFVVFDQKKIIARPPEWERIIQEEKRFIRAERERLLYVAATRAKQELVISRNLRSYSTKEPEETRPLWSSLYPALDHLAVELDLEIRHAPGRRLTERSASEVRALVADAESRVRRAATSSRSRRTVTESAKEERATQREYEMSVTHNRGTAWGRAVHRCFEALGRGRRGEGLRAYVSAVASDEGLLDDDCLALDTLIRNTESSDVWRGLLESPEMRFECPVMYRTEEQGRVQLTEGVMDAMIRSDGADGPAWTVIDWKTDACDDAEWIRRATAYTRQIQSYERMVQSLTGITTRSRLERV